MTDALVYIAIAALTIAVILADDRRRRAATREHITVTNLDDSPVADALADALEAHLNNGGHLYDVAGYQVHTHPSGAVHVELVLLSDPVAAAERILQEGA